MGDNNEQLQQELNTVKAEAYDMRKNLESQLQQLNQAVGEIAKVAGVDSLQGLFDFVSEHKPAEE